MDKHKICEAIYALPGSPVVKRRRSLSIPVALFAAGIAMIALNNLYGAQWTNNIRSALVFTGGVLALAGAAMSAVRLFGGSGVPYHCGCGSPLLCEELHFDREQRDDVAATVSGGDVHRLLALRRSEVPALTVVLYRTSDNRFAAMQAFEYADLEYRPVTALKIVGSEDRRN